MRNELAAGVQGAGRRGVRGVGDWPVQARHAAGQHASQRSQSLVLGRVHRASAPTHPCPSEARRPPKGCPRARSCRGEGPVGGTGSGRLAGLPSCAPTFLPQLRQPLPKASHLLLCSTPAAR